MSDIVNTYRKDNQFSFKCPIFNSVTKIRDCLNLRDEWAKGKEIPVRKGCQACLSASKCPIVPIISAISHKDGNDVYFSKEPKTGSLKKEILENIACIVVPQSTLSTYAEIPQAQLAAIDLVQGIKGVNAILGKAIKASVEIEKIPQKEAVESKSIDTSAASTGDMADVINKMMKDYK